MKRYVLMAAVVTLAMGGASYSQTAPKDKPSSQESFAASPAGDQTQNKQSALSESLEKAKKGIGEALEKTDKAVRETLGITKEGCLKAGNEADPYLLVERESAEEITVVGSAELANHINHTVRLHGEEEADGRVFHATAVDQISTSCDPLPEKYSNEVKPKGELTADDQGTSDADRKMTQRIRQAVVADESLSIHGKNIKIISRNGLVTLKGIVRGEDEKRNIEAKATAVAGIGRVSNELTVQADGPAKSGASDKN